MHAANCKIKLVTAATVLLQREQLNSLKAGTHSCDGHVADHMSF